MSEFETKDRSSVLDAFGAAQPRSQGELVPAPGYAPPAAKRGGAIAVEVYRDDARVLQKIKTLAAAAGDDWYYRFPVKNRKEGTTSYIEGASIKLANDVARIYGNCEIETRVVDIGKEWIIYARFTDVESGFVMERPFQQRKAQQSIGGRDDARAQDIALSIGVSKAIRNVITNALQTYCDFAFEEAKASLVDKIGRDIDKWRNRVAQRIGEREIDHARVEAVFGRPIKEWLAPDVARFVAMWKAIEDGMASIDDTFPSLTPVEPEEKPKAPAPLDGFAQEERKEDASSKPQPAAPEKEPPAARKREPKGSKNSGSGNAAGASGQAAGEAPEGEGKPPKSVTPAAAPAPSEQAPEDGSAEALEKEREELISDARSVALDGSKALEEWLSGADKLQMEWLAPELEALRKAAKAADEEEALKAAPDVLGDPEAADWYASATGEERIQYNAGKEAFRVGKSRSNPPLAIRKNETLLAAWQRGYDEEAASKA